MIYYNVPKMKRRDSGMQKDCEFYKDFSNIDNVLYADMCFAYHDGIEREDGLEWGHFPKCCPEKCPKLHPEILKENKAHWRNR